MARKQEAIQCWLDSARTWEDGLALYLKYGRNAALKKIFLASGNTSYNFQRLLDELRQMQTKPKSVAVETDNPVAIRQDDPRIIPLYRERQQLHAQLMVLPTDQQRKQAAFRIVQITQQLDKLLENSLPLGGTARRNAAQRPGPQADDTDLPKASAPGNLLKKLYTNRAYISKNRNRQDKQKQIQERILENQQIEKMMKS